MISLPSFPAAFVRGGGGSREIVLRSSETDVVFVSSSSRVPLSSRCRLSLVCLRRRGEGERGSAPSLRRRRGRRITSFAVNAGTTPKSSTFDANDRYARTANPFYEANCERYVEKILVKVDENVVMKMKKNSEDGVLSRNDGSATTVAANGALPGGGDGGGDNTTPLKEERWEKIHLSTEDERTKGSMDVSVVKLSDAAFRVKVKLDCPSILNEQDALMHWGMIGEEDEDWKSPKHFVRSVPPNGREPDAQSEESKFLNGRDCFEHVFDFTNGYRGERMAMLIRSEDCETWLRDEGRRSHAILDLGRMAVDARGGGSQQRVAAAPAPNPVAPPPPPQRQEEDHHHRHREEDNNSHEQQQQQHNHNHNQQQSTNSNNGERVFAAVSNWVGDDVELSNNRKDRSSRDRNRWDTSNLPSFAAALVSNDQSASSWRQKLQSVEKLLCENDGNDMEDALAYSTIYLFWISVGAISCVEDGTHYRPNHHAGSAERMFGKIESIEGTDNMSTLAAIRRLHPRLPAFTAEFTQSVPLTRIRDIAHGKGDEHGKCREVRQEIKHTIQNKLHRCAGPEDLVASEKMLQKLTAPGTDYPKAFVDEFEIFYRELKEFFNASGVAERLEKLANQDGGSKSADAANAFLRAKANADDQNASLKSLLETLRLLHESRTEIVRSFESGNIQDMSARQQWRLAEISLEDYAFVLLSRCSNLLGAESKPPKQNYTSEEVSECLNALAVSFDTLHLSSKSEEMQRVAEDARKLAGESASFLGSNDGGLRVNAIAERAKRAAENFCDVLENLFTNRAHQLGPALGIDNYAVDIFTEGQIRASVVFQSAKLAGALSRASRNITGAQGWDCVVQSSEGDIVYPLRRIEWLDPNYCRENITEPCILLCDSADGDEEVSTMGPNVMGIILSHALPHLSHLALRARQSAVPLVAVEDGALTETIRSFEGKNVLLRSKPGDVKIELTDAPVSGGASSSAPAALTASATASTAATISIAADTSYANDPLSFAKLSESTLDFAVSVAGSKSAFCAKLEKLSSDSHSSPFAFSAPTGVAIPFGAMEVAAEEAGKTQYLQERLQILDSNVPEVDLEAARRELFALVENELRPSQEVYQKVLAGMGASANSKAFVRSSANVEDLAGMSAAGLYDSIPNVDLQSYDQFALAVSKVWASLYTARAVASRKAARVSQKDAKMCALVQVALKPECSFVLHTKHPLTESDQDMYAEMALGLGETLASGNVRGTPWRFDIAKATKEVTVKTFSSFGEMYIADDSNSDSSALQMKRVFCDDGNHWLTTDEKRRNDVVGAKLGGLGIYLESTLGNVPQDVEGCLLSDGTLCVVQARPQP